MAAQVDLVRVKVEEKPRDGLDTASKERKKKKKREHSPCTEKHLRPEKDAKKIKLHHHQHQQHHHHQHVQQQRVPQQQQQAPQKKIAHGLNFNSKELAPVQHHNHHQHNNNNNHHHSPKKDAAVVWPPRKATPLPHKPAPAPAPLFTFTPLKVAKAESRRFTKPQKPPEKDVKLKLKKENAEVNVKVDPCKIPKQTGNTTNSEPSACWSVKLGCVQT